MHGRMRRLAVTLATALTLGVAACGGDDDAEPAGEPPSAAECPDGAVVIAMRDIKFVPDEATAKVGQTICWPNEDEIQHNAVAEEGADFKSELYGKGEVFSAAVQEAGTVSYVCTIHPGMDGTIEVTP
jgi:plastocyanin